MQNEITITQEYPTVLERVKAMFMDSITMVLFMLIATQVFSFFEKVPDIVRIVTFVFIFLLYDPIFTSTFGGTIGHMIIGISVKRVNNPTMNINLPFAILRFSGKVLLGWISLITVTTNQKKRAIHDFMGGSIVLYNRQPE